MLPATTKEAAPEVGASTEIEALNPSASSAAGQTQRMTDAIGAEVPVVVHASRYSSAGLGAGKNLPPVHEETRTVIVFPNGAVVRVGATMAAGELVVLTNQQTGADVICRVVNVKTQPGIQNYVNLEFTQRAPGFWDANSATPKNTPKNEPAYASSPLEEAQPVPLAALPKPVAVTRTETKSLIPPPAASKVSPEIATAKVASESSSAPFLVPKPERPDNSEPLSGSILGGGLLSGDSKLSQKTIGASADGQFKNWAFQNHADGKIARDSSGTKKSLMIAASAILLLGAGIGGGFWLRSMRTTGTPSQAASNSPEQSVPLPPVTTDQNVGLSAPDAAATSDSLRPAVVNSSASSSVPAAQPAAESEPSVQPAEQPSRAQTNSQSNRASANSARPNVQSENASVDNVKHTSIAVGKLGAPVARTAEIQESVEAPVVGQTNGAASGLVNGLGGSNSLGGGIAGDAPHITAPVIPTKTGGQIEAAKVLSSPAPSYPMSALDKRVEGVVTIDAALDNTGRVVSTTVVSGPPELQVAALNALRKWKYQPAMLNGLAVESHTMVSMSFHLPAKSSAQR
jgi:TonB family protein